MFKKFWHIWTKALGEKPCNTDDRTADYVALVRTFIVLVYLATNLLISINIIKRWNT